MVSQFLELTRPAETLRLSDYRDNPAAYAREILGVELTTDQSAMLQSIVRHRYTLAMASHGVGKTFTAGVAANWWFDCWDEHIAYVTAPTWKQALGLTFKQTIRLRKKKRLPGNILGSGIVRDPDDYLALSHYIRALNADTGEGFQGEHSAPILVILEEAVGVPTYIWEAMKGLMTHPDCRVFAIGNPTDEATQFGEASNSAYYNVIRINALEHANVQAELGCQPAPFPDATRLQWVYEMLLAECEIIDEHSPDSFDWWSPEVVQAALRGQPITPSSTRVIYQPNAMFQGRVLGLFPTQADQQVIPRGWIEKIGRLPLEAGHCPEIGCDVARFGDDRTVIAGRQGAAVLAIEEKRKLDSRPIVEAIKAMIEDLIAGTNWKAKRVPIKLDVTGGLGTGPLDMLKEEGFNAFGVNSSERAFDDEQYPNRRSELWFDTQSRVKEGSFDLTRLPVHQRQQAIKELSTPKYTIRVGRKVVEDKTEMKKRLGYSPDIADAINLAFAPPPRNAMRLTPSVSRRT